MHSIRDSPEHVHPKLHLPAGHLRELKGGLRVEGQHLHKAVEWTHTRRHATVIGISISPIDW
jgi:hypothetical protein